MIEKNAAAFAIEFNCKDFSGKNTVIYTDTVTER